MLNKIIRKVVSSYYWTISPIYRVYETNKLRTYGNKQLRHQPIFIIGAPRTGSTILYQILSNTLDVLYIDNLVCKWHRNFFVGFQKSYKKYGATAHNIFKSVHGNTSMFGEHGPSECGEFWYRWFPNDRHFLEVSDVPEEDIEAIRKNISAVINYYDKPLLFKNLNAGQRLRVLSKAFPNAKFIWVQRNPIRTGLSIIQAKRRLKLELNEYWSIMPPNVADLKKMSNGYRQITAQIHSLEKQIEIDKNLFPKENFFTVTYEDILKNTDQVVNEIKAFMGENIQLRTGVTQLEVRKEKPIEKGEDYKRLKMEVEKLDWSYV